MRWTWIGHLMAAEALAFTGVALSLAWAAHGLLPNTIAVVGAGFWEGLCLGSAQALVLARLGVRPLPWAISTVLIAVFGYAAGLIVHNSGSLPNAPGIWMVLVYAAALGGLYGLFMGTVQSMVARGAVDRIAWIGRTAIGWAFAMPVIFFGSSLVSLATDMGTIALTGAVTGAIAGLLIARATAPALPDLAEA
jgi:hypothetical protein